MGTKNIYKIIVDKLILLCYNIIENEGIKKTPLQNEKKIFEGEIL